LYAPPIFCILIKAFSNSDFFIKNSLSLFALIPYNYYAVDATDVIKVTPSQLFSLESTTIEIKVSTMPILPGLEVLNGEGSLRPSDVPPGTEI